MMIAMARMAINRNHSLLKKLITESNMRFIAVWMFGWSIPTIGPDVMCIDPQLLTTSTKTVIVYGQYQ